MREPGPITDDEVEVMNSITEAWNRFQGLPRAHPDELSEFRAKIHDLQRMILVRALIDVRGSFAARAAE